MKRKATLLVKIKEEIFYSSPSVVSSLSTIYGVASFTIAVTPTNPNAKGNTSLYEGVVRDINFRTPKAVTRGMIFFAILASSRLKGFPLTIQSGNGNSYSDATTTMTITSLPFSDNLPPHHSTIFEQAYVAAVIVAVVRNQLL